MAYRVRYQDVPLLLKTLAKWLPACLPVYRLISHSENNTWPTLKVYTNCENMDEITTVLCSCGNYGTADNGVSYTFYSTDNVHLKEVLNDHGVIDWDSEVSYFQIVSSSQLHVIEGVMSEHDKLLHVDEELCTPDYLEGCCHIYTLSNHKRGFAMVEQSLPEGFRFGNLKPEHNSLLQSKWHYPLVAPSLQYYANAIQNLPNLAIYNEKDEIVSWAVIKAFGDIGHTYTMPEYRRRGFASLITAHLTKRMLDADTQPYVVIRSTFEGSIKAHEKLGFTKLNEVGVDYYVFV